MDDAIALELARARTSSILHSDLDSRKTARNGQLDDVMFWMTSRFVTSVRHE